MTLALLGFFLAKDMNKKLFCPDDEDDEGCFGSRDIFLDKSPSELLVFKNGQKHLELH